LNGNEEGEWTGSRGETVIDYGILNKESWERVEEFRIGERVESAYFPLEISIEGEKEQQKRSRRRWQ
jgi:hypothetical protein